MFKIKGGRCGPNLNIHPAQTMRDRLTDDTLGLQYNGFSPSSGGDERY